MAKTVPIAIVGMSCRLPGGANSPEQLWEMLHAGRSGHGPIPETRWNADAFYHGDPGARESVPFRTGHFLQGDDISAFDARFFRVAPRDANGMDPQQRLLLEATYEALENAGMTLDAVRGSDTAVVMAEFARDYDRMAQKDVPNVHKMHVLGYGDAILANRISYTMDLRGPSFTLDTGCSGSLVAVHQACQSIRTGESSMAIAGGCQLILHPDQGMNMSQINMMNPDGKCYVFDERGTGYGRGEGAGVVILKRLDHALRDGDAVHAVIAGSGVNQDGKTMGISLPNAEAQTALARSVYAAAGLDPAETLYVEAHGTGTQAGDKAEISSIDEVFCQTPGRASDIYVGSIKANIGHLECASGIAALIKSVMVLKKGFVPANINLETLKPALQAHVEGRPIKIPTEVVPLADPSYRGPRRVSVSGFGYGGTNAHVILETVSLEDGVSAIQLTNGITNGHANGHTNSHTNGHVNGHANGHSEDMEASNGTNGSKHSPEPNHPQLYMLSAASEISLSTMASRLQTWILDKQLQDSQLRDLSYTLAARRSLHGWRSAIVAPDVQTLTEQLARVKPTKIPGGGASPPSVTFIFTGQGAQWHAMGRELLLSSSVFRDSIYTSSRLLKSWGSPWSLDEELQRDDGHSRLGESELAQPATTAIQVALVDLLSHVGIVPQRVCGHSSGEIGAAYAAGALSHEAALKVSYWRGICSKKAKHANPCRGSMLSTGLGEDAILPYVKAASGGQLVTACINSPESTTVSGDEAAIDDLAETLTSRGIFNRKLRVDTAYHSHHMAAVADDYLASLEDMEYSAPRSGTAFFSSVTGSRKTSEFGPAYWTQNLVSPVQFHKALGAAAEDMSSSGSSSANIFVEIGPHAALQGPSRQILSAMPGGSLKHTYLSPLIRKQHAVKTTLEVLGRLFESGCAMDMEKVSNIVSSQTKRPSVMSDLPPYPWDHSSTYWHESRLSRDHRLRRFPYHDLLGVLDVVGDTHSPRWRHHIDPDATPWLRDHVVDNFILFPGTGYLCMAIEALSQLLQLRKTPGVVDRFVLRDVKFLKPLVVPQPAKDGERQQVEVQIELRTEGGASKNLWEAFRVSSYDSSSAAWTEHCTGSVGVQMERGAGEFEVESDRESAAVGLLNDIKTTSTTAVDAAGLYDDLASSGNVFGPTFRGLSELRLGEREACAKVVIPDIASGMPASYMQPHVAHPTTLDALNHVAAAMYRRHCGSSPVVAAGIDELSVSAGVTSEAGAELVVASRMTTGNSRAAAGNTWVFQGPEGSERPVITMTGWRFQSVGEAKPAEGDVPFQRSMTYKMEWRENVDSLSNDVFNAELADKGLYGIGYPEGMSVSEVMYLRESAALIYIKRAVQNIEASGRQIDTSAPHIAKLYNWMRQVSSEDNTHWLPVIPQYPGALPENDNDREDFILQQAPKTGAQGAMLERIGSHLESILTGSTAPLPLMFSDDLLERVYGEDMMQSTYAQMAQYTKLLAFKHPRMEILEIGAGTGGATLPILQALEDPVDGPLFDRYCYTDISSGFFDKARARFAPWAHRMDFRTLDISRDPLAQAGFSDDQGEKFDLIVAANVLHATPLLDETVANCRKLLRPGGRLMLMEVTRLTLTLNTIFGTLPGWWMSEDGRESTPTVPVPRWDAVLRRRGFAGVEIAVPDHRGDTAVMTAMVGRAAVEEEHATTNGASRRNSITVLLGHRDEASELLADSLCHSLAEEAHIDCHTEDIASATIHEDGSYIMLDAADHGILKDPSPAQLSNIQKLVTRSREVLWVSFQSSSDSANSVALKGMVNGLARVARNEASFVKLVTLDIRDQVTTADQATNLASSIVSVARASFWPTTAPAEEEREYAIQGGKVLVPRIRVDAAFNSWVASTRADNKTTTSTVYHKASRPLKLEVETPGLLNTLRFVDDGIPLTPLAPHEIQVRPHAHGVNFKDVFVALGQGPPGAIMVGEVCGVVTEVGSGMTGRYRIGDRVAGMGAEPFASGPRLHGLNAHRIPDGLSFVDGASAMVVFCTAWYCLVTVANLKRGETVLIRYVRWLLVPYSGSGGVGQAAIQIAQHLGADIYTTVGSASKRQLLIDTYILPPSRILSSGSTTFRDDIMHLTGGRGVDVVLNSLAGDQAAASLACVAEFGRFVEIGKADIYRRGRLSMAHFDRGISLAAVDFVLIMQQRPQIVHDTLAAVFDLFGKGILSAVKPVTTFPVDRIEEAFRLIAARKHTGKLVIVADETSTVQASLPPPEPLRLHAGGTYVVLGGLGDLGRRVCGLLARAGAGHIVTLSRSLPAEDELEAFRRGIQEQGDGNGCTLHTMRCDVTDTASVLRAADICRAQLPPVRGVVHSGLALSDRPLELMTHDEYMTAVRPKVHGTLHLHDAFASDTLDFLILLSSSTGIIGMKGQANYAAGNTFQDAFADAHNANLGDNINNTGSSGRRTRYVSLDIGAVAGSGHISRLPLQGVEMQKQSVLFMTFDEVTMLLEYAMGPLAAQHGFSHCMAGFDRDVMVTMQDTASLDNPLFSLLPETGGSDEAPGGAGGPGRRQAEQDPGLLVQRAKTLDEAREIITKATADKFSVFLDAEVAVDVPIVQLAIDSLVSIELKNWMSRTFQAPVQASEIAGALSIKALAELLTSRSKCISDELRGDLSSNDVNGDVDPETEKVNGDHHSTSKAVEKGVTPAHGWDCCKYSETLPKSPLVDLDDAIDYMLDNSGHFFPPDEFKLLQEAADDLRAPGGPGRAAYAWLVERYNDPTQDSWLHDMLTEVIYLRRRFPLAPYSSFVSSSNDSGAAAMHTQGERAAIITLAALDFRRRVLADEVEPHWYFARATCTAQLKWLFDSVREPGVDVDRMRIYQDSEYIVVLRRGHVFKVDVSDGVSHARLRAIFETITSSVEDDGLWTGLLTSDNRTSWAENRALALQLSPSNIEYIKTIEEATFVICLDDTAPETDSDQVRHAWFGNGFNRWGDKGMQIIVSANGKSTFILEHGAIDGLTGWRFSEWIQQAILDTPPAMPPANGSSSPKVDNIDLQELVFQSTPDLDRHMLTLRDRYIAASSTAEYKNHFVHAFGTSDLMAWGMPVKSVLDATVQLAIRLHFGASVPCWEGVSMSHFHRGRNDMLQITSAPAARFCAAALDESIPLIQRRAQLLALGRDMTAAMKRCQSGRNHLRFFELLREAAWPAGAPKGKMFVDNIFWRNPFVILQHVPQGVAGANMLHGVQKTGCFFISVSPRSHSIHVAIDGTTGNTEPFAARLDEAAQIIKRIIQAK